MGAPESSSRLEQQQQCPDSPTKSPAALFIELKDLEAKLRQRLDVKAQELKEVDVAMKPATDAINDEKSNGFPDCEDVQAMNESLDQLRAFEQRLEIKAFVSKLPDEIREMVSNALPDLATLTTQALIILFSKLNNPNFTKQLTKVSESKQLMPKKFKELSDKYPNAVEYIASLEQFVNSQYESFLKSLSFNLNGEPVSLSQAVNGYVAFTNIEALECKLHYSVLEKYFKENSGSYELLTQDVKGNLQKGLSEFNKAFTINNKYYMALTAFKAAVTDSNLPIKDVFSEEIADSSSKDKEPSKVKFKKGKESVDQNEGPDNSKVLAKIEELLGDFEGGDEIITDIQRILNDPKRYAKQIPIALEDVPEEIKKQIVALLCEANPTINAIMLAIAKRAAIKAKIEALTVNITLPSGIPIDTVLLAAVDGQIGNSGLPIALEALQISNPDAYSEILSYFPPKVLASLNLSKPDTQIASSGM